MSNVDVGLAEQGFFSLALSRRVLPKAIKVTLIVGTLLAFINHGENILSMSLNRDSVLKILLTYLVPYCVSTWSAVSALKGSAPKKAPHKL